MRIRGYFLEARSVGIIAPDCLSQEGNKKRIFIRRSHMKSIGDLNFVRTD
jgi:hypothetical protein